MKHLPLLILLCLTTAATVLHGSDLDSVRNYRMEDVVVTATRTPLPIKNTPVITRVISAVEAERSGVATIQDLLQRELAGVEFHQAGYGTTLSFQGLDARYVLFLIDGERMAGETYGNIDYARIPLNNIERIEIVRGASSVLYGSNAMGAVVNIITRMPKERVEVSGSIRYGTRFQKNSDETLPEGTPEDQLQRYHDRIDRPNTYGNLSLGLNLGRFRSLTSGTFRTVDAYKLHGRKEEVRHYKSLTPMQIASMGSGMPTFSAGTPIADTTLAVGPDSRGLGVSGWRDWNLSQRFDYTLNKQFRFELSGNYFNKARSDFQTSIMDDNPLSGILPGDPGWSYETYEGYNIKALMEHSPNEHHKIYLSFLRDEYYRDLDSLNGYHAPKQRHTYNIPRLLWTWNAGSWNRLTTGIEMINEQLRFDLNPKGFDDVKSMNSAAVYVQDELWSGHRLSFVAGLRADWSDQFGWRATPKLSAKYTVGDVSLRANYSNGYRSPTLKELYMQLDIPIANSPLLLGNANLKPESNHYLSLSLEYNHDGVNLSATVNKSYFRNKIDARRLSPEAIEAAGIEAEEGKQVMRYENIDRSEFGSIELIGRLRLARGLHLNANYNYVYQNDDNTPEGSTQYIFPSPHTATLALDYAFTFHDCRIGLNGNVRYVSGKDYEDFMPYLNIPKALADFIVDRVNGKPMTGPPGPEVIAAMRQFKYYTGSYTAHHEGYAVCNVTLNIEFRRYVALTLGVDNLFDYRPAVVNFNSAVLPGRNGFASLSFRF